MRGFNHRKAVQALNFLAEKEGGKINKMKAIKLIGLADKLHLLKHGRSITGDSYFALPKGTVPSFTRDLLEQSDFSLGEDELTYSSEFIAMDGYDYRSSKPLNAKVFSKSDLEAITTVFRVYGKKNHWELSEISHEFPEWKQYEDALKRKIASRFPIDTEDFFLPSPSTHPIFKDIDPLIVEMSKEIYLTQKKTESYLK